MLILAAMFVQSSRVAIHGAIAVICGNLTGRFMGFDESFLTCGLFGYNSFLVGLAIATFGDNAYSWTVLIGVVVTSSLSSVLFVMLGKILAPYKVSPCRFQYECLICFSYQMMLITVQNRRHHSRYLSISV